MSRSVHVEHHPHPRRKALQEPDVRDGRGELDVAPPLAADLASVTSTPPSRDDAAVLQALYLPQSIS